MCSVCFPVLQNTHKHLSCSLKKCCQQENRRNIICLSIVLVYIFCFEKNCRYLGFECAKLLFLCLCMCGKLAINVTACLSRQLLRQKCSFSVVLHHGGNGLSSVLSLFSGQLPNIIVCLCSVSKICSFSIQIMMPSGTYITVGYSCYSTDDCHLDVAVYPLTEDSERAEGLCGNYNGDMSDDLVPKDSDMVDDRSEPINFTTSYM